MHLHKPYTGKSTTSSSYYISCESLNRCSYYIHYLCPVPPSRVSLSGNVSVVADRDSTVFTCTSDSANPAATLTWRRNGIIVSATTGAIITKGDFNGDVTTQALTIRPTRSDDGVQYSCSPSNGIGNQIHSDTLTLNLVCK